MRNAALNVYDERTTDEHWVVNVVSNVLIPDESNILGYREKQNIVHAYRVQYGQLNRKYYIQVRDTSTKETTIKVLRRIVEVYLDWESSRRST